MLSPTPQSYIVVQTIIYAKISTAAESLRCWNYYPHTILYLRAVPFWGIALSLCPARAEKS